MTATPPPAADSSSPSAPSGLGSISKTEVSLTVEQMAATIPLVPAAPPQGVFVVNPTAGIMVGVYRLDQKLGEGGMGAVWKAFHVKLEKHVALKVLPAQFTRDPLLVARFEREMRAVGKIEHPNVVRAMDAGEFQGLHYLVMEYVDGTDLDQLVKTNGALPVCDACEFLRQAALGLSAAHKLGLVHRDIKPSNLFLTGARDGAGGAVKILDLGLAQLQDDTATDKGAGLTGTGTVMGTPDYMAPEQWNDMHGVDGRADLYSLGCTLFFLLTGRPPYGDEAHQHVYKKMAGHVEDPIPDLRAARSETPLDVDALYRRLLAKESADRIQSADELAQTLLAIVKRLESGPRESTEPLAAPDDRQNRAPQPFGISERPQESGRDATPPSFAAVLRGRTRSRFLTSAWMVAGVAVLALLAGVLMKSWKRDSRLAGIVAPVGGGGEHIGMGESKAARVGWSGWPTGVPDPAIAPFDAVQAKKHQDEWSAYLKTPVEYTHPIGMKFVLCPPGRFTMGSSQEEVDSWRGMNFGEKGWIKDRLSAELPQHEVELSTPFYLGTTEVTFGQFRRFVEAESYPMDDLRWKEAGFEQTDNHPAIWVSWQNALDFCRWLGKQDGKTYRLPTEAEWEFSCRAGRSGTRYCCGDDEGELEQYAWCNRESAQRTYAVGQKKAGDWGLHDMHGNVWEWCQDGYDPRYYKDSPAKDPLNPSGRERVFRGGSWSDAGVQCRCAYRLGREPEFRLANLGFRVVLVAPPGERAEGGTTTGP